MFSQNGIPNHSKGDKKKAINYLDKLIDVYNYWHEDDFLNKEAHIYIEAIFKMVDEKIKEGEATAEQVKFLVDTLLEAKNYRIPGLGYPGEKNLLQILLIRILKVPSSCFEAPFYYYSEI
jgi:hypothetical protein